MLQTRKKTAAPSQPYQSKKYMMETEWYQFWNDM